MQRRGWECGWWESSGEVTILWSSIYFCFSTFSILVCSSCVLSDFLLLTLPGSVLVNWVQRAGGWACNPTLLLVSLKYMKKVWKLGMLLVPWKVQVPEKKYVRLNHIKVTIFEIKKIFFNWKCVSFCCTIALAIYKYAYIPSLWCLLPPPPISSL